MFKKAQLERLFVSSVMLAFASLALSIVGIKSQLFQTIQFLLLFIALMSLVVLGFQSKTIQFNANRLKKQIIGWMFSSIFSIVGSSLVPATIAPAAHAFLMLGIKSSTPNAAI